LGKKLKSESLHSGFSIDKAGLTIYQSHPFLAASPDAIFNCPCHGRAVVEVKYAVKLSTIFEAYQIQNEDYTPSIFFMLASLIFNLANQSSLL
jgi:hypothetical protein